mmetsp:Transcript_12382/g.20398  ORF Transcript_12382/g.20398 Transcript_12382/m.20398 type:complete len:681 (-) Transcript_12382:185-2227(-)
MTMAAHHHRFAIAQLHQQMISRSAAVQSRHRHLSTKRPPPPPPTQPPSQDNITEPNPLLKISNLAQQYESRHSTGLFGFNTHDGPVPIKSIRKAVAGTKSKQQLSRSDKNQSLIEPTTFHRASVAAKLKQRSRDDDESPSLIDPFYTPKQPDQTHFILGGTPYDNNVGRSYRLADYGESSVYTLILLRHGESEWNCQNLNTGWTDVNLTKRGEDEARAAGRLLAENGIEIDHAFTSVLKRASFTLDKCLQVAGQHWVPITKTWRLNERHYGSLQGYNKDTAWKELNLDQELYMEMRRSYGTPPPRMEDDHPYWHGNDRRYSKLTEEQLERSRSESLRDAAERIMPFFNSVIVPSLREGNRCLVVSHANTIRTLIKQIDGISDEDIKQLSIPTGIPLIYRLDENLRPVDPNHELEFKYLVQPKGYTWATSRTLGFHGVYLGDLERLQDIQKKRDATNRGWQRIILRNIARQVNEEDIAEDHLCYYNHHFHSKDIVETKHLWCRIVQKLKNPEFANMLLLVRMKEYLESILAYRKHHHGQEHHRNKNYRYIPLASVEKIIEEIHLGSEGDVVDPFVSLEDRKDREERHNRWMESLATYSDESLEESLKRLEMPFSLYPHGAVYQHGSADSLHGILVFVVLVYCTLHCAVYCVLRLHWYLHCTAVQQKKHSRVFGQVGCWMVQ